MSELTSINIARISAIQQEIKEQAWSGNKEDLALLKVAFTALKEGTLGQNRELVENLSTTIVAKVVDGLQWPWIKKVASAVYRIFSGGVSLPHALLHTMTEGQVEDVVVELDKKMNVILSPHDLDEEDDLSSSDSASDDEDLHVSIDTLDKMTAELESLRDQLGDVATDAINTFGDEADCLEVIGCLDGCLQTSLDGLVYEKLKKEFEEIWGKYPDKAVERDKKLRALYASLSVQTKDWTEERYVPVPKSPLSKCKSLQKVINSSIGRLSREDAEKGGIVFTRISSLQNEIAEGTWRGEEEDIAFLTGAFAALERGEIRDSKGFLGELSAVIIAKASNDLSSLSLDWPSIKKVAAAFHRIFSLSASSLPHTLLYVMRESQVCSHLKVKYEEALQIEDLQEKSQKLGECKKNTFNIMSALSPSQKEGLLPNEAAYFTSREFRDLMYGVELSLYETSYQKLRQAYESIRATSGDKAKELGALVTCLDEQLMGLAQNDIVKVLLGYSSDSHVAAVSFMEECGRLEDRKLLEKYGYIGGNPFLKLLELKEEVSKKIKGGSHE